MQAADIIKRYWPILASVLVSAILSFQALGGITDRPLSPDARENAWTIYRIATTGVFSNTRPGRDVTPSMRREPVPALVGAAYYAADPALSGPIEELTEGQRLHDLKEINGVWALALFGGLFVLCQLIFTSRTTAVVVGTVVSVLSLKLLVADEADGLMTELPAAAAMVWASVAGLNFVQRPTLVSGELMGLAFALTALTRAPFFYIALIALPILAFASWWSARAEQNTLRRWAFAPVTRALTMAVLAFAIICGGWMTRNLVRFGEFAISERGGTVLFYRSLEMELPLAGAYYAWSPQPYRGWVGSLTGYTEEDLNPGGRLTALVRNNPDSILANRYDGRMIYRERIEAAGIDYSSLSTHERDAWLGRAGVRSYIGNPVRYFAWLPAFAYKGSFVCASKLHELGAISRALPYDVALLLYLNFIVVACAGILTLRQHLLPAFLLPAGLAAFNIMLTHNLARYTEPLIPFMLLAAMVSVVFVARRARALIGKAGAAQADRAQPALGES